VNKKSEKINWDVFYKAIQQENWGEIEELLKNPDFIIAKDLFGCTALHYVCAHGNFDLVKYLIKKGAEVNVQNNQGETPLHLAIDYDTEQSTSIAKYLLDHGALIEVKDKWNWTPLYKAVMSPYNLEIVVYLIAKGASFKEGFDDYGYTVLHWAIARSKGRLEVVQYLVEKGADMLVKTECGKTAIDIAQEEGHNLIKEYLEKRISQNS